MLKLMQVTKKAKIKKEGNDEDNNFGGTMRDSDCCYCELCYEPEKQQPAVFVLFWFNGLHGMPVLLQVLQMRRLYFMCVL